MHELFVFVDFIEVGDSPSLACFWFVLEHLMNIDQIEDFIRKYTVLDINLRFLESFDRKELLGSIIEHRDTPLGKRVPSRLETA